MLSSADLDEATVGALTDALVRRPRPLAVANPDIVAPREDGPTREPGFYAHAIADTAGLRPAFFGKPFGDAYDDALARLGSIPRRRIAMVGDTLHTDVPGGAAAGMGTVLIERHGLFGGLDVVGYVARSGIVPDVICATTSAVSGSRATWGSPGRRAGGRAWRPDEAGGAWGGRPAW